MKTAGTRTLCLIPESESEHEHWETVLGPYCWADGEFGMLLTEAAFRQLKSSNSGDTNIPQVVRRGMATVAAVLEAGDYADVCLQHTATSADYASGKIVA